MEQRREMTKKNRTNLRILQIVLLILIFASFIPGIISAGQMLFIEDESKVWGIAYHFLGVDWSTYIPQDSLVSFGYSFLIAPICAILDSPGAIYKAIVLGNALAICLSYVLSLYVCGKVFPQENKVLVSISCALAALCPALAMVKLIAVPDMFLILVFWIALSFLVAIGEKPTTGKIIGFAITLGIAQIFHTMMICVMIAGVLVLFRYVKQQTIEEKQFWKAILCMAIFVLLSQGLEKLLLSDIFGGDYQNTGLGILFSGILENWKKEGIFGLLQSIAGRLFCLGAGSLLTIFWGGMSFAHRRNLENAPQYFVKVTFLITLIITALYYSNYTTGDDVLNSRMLFVIAGPLIIKGIIEIFGNKKWIWYLNISIGILVLTAFISADSIKAFTLDSIQYFNTGILFGSLEMLSENMQSNIYIITIAVLIIAILILVLVRNNFKNRRIKNVVILCGSVAAIGAVCTADILIPTENVIKEGENIQQNFAKITSLVSEAASDIPIYYLATGEAEDEEIAITQYLLGKHQLHYINETNSIKSNEERMQSEQFESALQSGDSIGILMSCQDSRVDEYTDEFGLVELTNKQALFVRKDNADYESIQKASTERIYKFAQTEEETISLVPGTYQCEISVRFDDVQTGDKLIISVSNGKNVIKRTTIALEEGMTGKQGIGITFATDKPLDDIHVSVKVKENSTFLLSDIIYRKVSDKYRIGVNNEDKFSKICSTISRLDQEQESKGEVGIVENELIREENIDLLNIKEELPDYNITFCDKEGDAKSRYLISSTQSRDFYSYLDEYAIIEMNNYYTLLLKNDAIELQDLKQAGIDPKSDGRKFDLTGFFGTESGEADISKPLSIMSGNYVYVLEVLSDSNANGEKTGLVQLVSNDEVIGEAQVQSADFDENGKKEVEIPIAVREDIDDLTIETEGDCIVEVKPLYLEMTSAKFQVGSDDPEGMEEITELINRIGIPSTVYYVTTEKVKESRAFSLSQIQEALQGYEIVNATQDEVKYLQKDCFLILEDFGSGYMGLTEYYSMIAQKGMYSLWVANYGTLMNTMNEQGIGVMTVGNKVPVSSLSAGKSSENSIGQLGRGLYEITLNITAEEVDDFNIAMIQIIGKQSEEEAIDQYIKQAIEAGSMEQGALKDQKIRDEVSEFVPYEEVLTTLEVDSEMFKDGNSTILNLSVRLLEKVDGIEVKVINYHGNNVTAEAKWIEKK